MRITLAHKFVASLFAALITCCSVVLFLSITLMKRPVEEELNKGIHRMQNVIVKANTAIEQRYLSASKIAALEDSLILAVLDRDEKFIKEKGKEIQAAAETDFVVVTDDKGVVLARSHSDKRGDSIISQETVSLALQGQSKVAFAPGAIVPLSLRATSPLKKDGKIVGTVSMGLFLSSPEYLDNLKSLSGVDVTLFSGDTRVMTSIIRDGQRIVGTKLDSPEILDAVLKNKQTFYIQDVISGEEYNSVYWPLINAEGKVEGLWGAGLPMKTLLALEHEAIYWAIVAGSGLLVIQLIISVIVGLRLNAPVSRITAYARAIAEGRKDAELTVRGRDDMGELADSLRSMENNLRELVSESTGKAEEARIKGEEAEKAMEEAREAQKAAENARREGMIGAAEEIEKAMEKLNASLQGISAQVAGASHALDSASSRLTETATAMKEMNSTVLGVARNASGAAETSSTAHSLADDGSEIVGRAMTGIQTVHERSLALKAGMTELDEHAGAISRIMGVISDIADQTNLLALNAAIEAARAGDAGRGFAVVADEVRKLAEKTMVSTKDVGEAIASIQKSASRSLEQVNEAVSDIAAASGESGRSGEALQKIVGMVEQTSDEINAIATASEEQSAASEEINRALSEVNQITAETAQAMQEAMTTLENLKHESDNLMQFIADMKK